MNLDLPIVGLSLAIFGSASGAILASYHSRGRFAFYILKPLTTLLILILAVSSIPASLGDYSALVALGLLFSLAGDIFLMLPPEHFSRGILSFSVTHALYFLAFASVAGVEVIHPLTPLFAVLAVVLATVIWRGVRHSLRIPVLLYTILITAMSTQAAGAAIAQATTRVAIGAAAALLFFLSDAMLAIDRFRSPFIAARAVVLSSYWIGQWLFAISARM
jgi:uncharacterized membrane protein YhhN